MNFFKKIKSNKLNRGFTYVELIVVLSIFTVMSSIIMFDYNRFQSQVDIKNVANDVALQIVQAQKDAMNGKLNDQAVLANPNWKPSYGVFFQPSYIIFYPYVDLTGDGHTSDDLQDSISITKGIKISDLKIYCINSSGGTPLLSGFKPPYIDINFTRPNSNAKITVPNASQPPCATLIDHTQIILSSADNSMTSSINVYSSGRIEIK